jgi:hypothetical protein
MDALNERSSTLVPDRDLGSFGRNLRSFIGRTVVGLENGSPTLAPLANAIHQVERLRRLHATEPVHPAVLVVYRRAMRTEAVPLEASRLQAVDHHLDERALAQHGVHVVALPDPCDLGQHDPALRLVLDDPRGRRQVGT